MTLETERKKDRGSSNDLSFIHLAQPPRHPKQSRRATLKSLSPTDPKNYIHNQALSARVLKKATNSDHRLLSEASKHKLQKNDEKNIPAFASSPLTSFRRKSHVPLSQWQNISTVSSLQSFQFPDSKRKLSLCEKTSDTIVDDVFDKKLNSDKLSQVKDKQDKDLILDLFFRSTQNFNSEFKKELEADVKSAKCSPSSKTKVPKRGLTSDNQIIPAIPPPPDMRGRSPSRVIQGCVDLMDLSSEDEKSTTSSTQTLSTLQSIVSPTITTVPEQENAPLTISSNTSTLTIKSPQTTSVSSSNSLNATSPTLSTKLLQARLSLTGLSPPHLMTSEEFSKNANTFYTPLTTPDLKIDLLESDGRRASMADRLSPPMLPTGFPFITPEDLTPEELHEFHMKWGSPHHAKGGRTGRPTLLTLPANRPRVTSLPNRKEDRDDEEDEYYRLRHFSITGKVVVNRGDSFKSRRSKSNNSVASDVSSNEGWAWSHPGSVANSAASSAASSRASSASEGAFPFRVVMLGAAGVGKTTICHQFMSSEHINGYDSSLDDEYGEKSVSIMLDSEESEILLIDHPADEMSVENYLATYNPHAIIVVFSVIDRQSFVRAEEIVQYLWRLDVMSHKGVILVANKTDLVRNRCISVKECSNLADSYDCKFIETSSGLNHQVDELLVGVVKQIRLKTRNPDLSREVFRKRSCRRKKYRGTKTSASLKVKSLLTKVCGKEIKSKSCENLHVL